MSEQQKHFPEFYVTAPQACPYLPGRLERKLFTHLTHDKPPALVDNLLKGGFRRSQNIAYMPYCEGCQACVSVRVVVERVRAEAARCAAWSRPTATSSRAGCRRRRPRSSTRCSAPTSTRATPTAAWPT